MKKIISVIIVSSLALAVILFALMQPNKSYISFENECIEITAPIEEVAEKTMREFPECIIKSRGRLFNSDYIYGRCGNSALNMTEFLITADKQDCEVYSSMGQTQKRKTVMGQN